MSFHLWYRARFSSVSFSLLHYLRFSSVSFDLLHCIRFAAVSLPMLYYVRASTVSLFGCTFLLFREAHLGELVVDGERSGAERKRDAARVLLLVSGNSRTELISLETKQKP